MSRGDFGYGATRTYHDEPSDRRNYSDQPSAGPGGRPGQGVFHDSGSGSYSILIDQITNNIFTVNNSAGTLERCTKQIGTDKDSDQLRDRIHSTEQSTNRVINETANKIRQLSSICSRGTDRQQKLQCERLTGEFKDTVKRYNNFQKSAAQKVKTCVILPNQTAPHPAKLIDWGEDGNDEAELLSQQQQQQQMHQQEVIDSDTTLIRDRETRILQLESDILDINEIFRDLGTLVHEQGIVIDTIETHVEHTTDHVEAGHQQLVQASEYQRKARKKKCIIVAILLVVVAVITVIIVVSVKH